jgi:thiol-disulfide isomerase/thioredoxin
VVALAALGVAGCGGPAPNQEPAGTGPQSSASTGSAQVPSRPPGNPTPTVGQVPAALQFTASTVDGKPFDGACLAGRPVVFWFWAAWCPRCRSAGPGIGAVGREYAGRVEIVGVAGLGSGTAQMRSFIQAAQVDGLIHLADDRGAVWQHFAVTAQEYYVIVDASGQVTHRGALSSEQLRSRVAQLAG